MINLFIYSARVDTKILVVQNTVKELFFSITCVTKSLHPSGAEGEVLSIGPLQESVDSSRVYVLHKC